MPYYGLVLEGVNQDFIREPMRLMVEGCCAGLTAVAVADAGAPVSIGVRRGRRGLRVLASATAVCSGRV